MTDRHFPALGDIDDYRDMMRDAREGRPNPCVACEKLGSCVYCSPAVVRCSGSPETGQGVQYADGYGPPEDGE